jgi:hypothetical protein
VAIDVLDKDVHLGRPPNRRRIPEAARGLAEIDAASVRCDLELGVQPSGRACGAVELAETKGVGQELDRGLTVFVEQIRSYGLCYGA